MLALIFGGVAVICFTSVAAALTPWMVPIRVHIDKRRRGTDGIHVDLCEMDWVTYKKNPTLYPLNPDLLSLSLCVNSSHMALAVPFRVLEAEYIALGCSSSERDDEATVLACEPAGIIQHEARVGSTLAANMLAVLPHTLVYPESTVPFDLLNWHIQSLSAAEVGSPSCISATLTQTFPAHPAGGPRLARCFCCSRAAHPRREARGVACALFWLGDVLQTRSSLPKTSVRDGYRHEAPPRSIPFCPMGVSSS